MSRSARLWIVAGAMGCCTLATMWVRAGFQFEVVPLQRDLPSITGRRLELPDVRFLPVIR